LRQPLKSETVIVRGNHGEYVGETRAMLFESALNDKGEILSDKKGKFLGVEIKHVGIDSVTYAQPADIRPGTDEEIAAVLQREEAARETLDRERGKLWAGGGKTVYTQAA
jgi:hypothetical protein